MLPCIGPRHASIQPIDPRKTMRRAVGPTVRVEDHMTQKRKYGMGSRYPLAYGAQGKYARSHDHDGRVTSTNRGLPSQPEDSSQVSRLSQTGKVLLDVAVRLA